MCVNSFFDHLLGCPTERECKRTKGKLSLPSFICGPDHLRLDDSTRVLRQGENSPKTNRKSAGAIKMKNLDMEIWVNGKCSNTLFY